jgi:hypothetical protein
MSAYYVISSHRDDGSIVRSHPDAVPLKRKSEPDDVDSASTETA